MTIMTSPISTSVISLFAVANTELNFIRNYSISAQYILAYQGFNAIDERTGPWTLVRPSERSLTCGMEKRYRHAGQGAHVAIALSIFEFPSGDASARTFRGGVLHPIEEAY